MAEDTKPTDPPPPPFWKLFTDDSKGAIASPEAAALWQPPPPPNEDFLKFGALQSVGYMKHELGVDVPKLYHEPSDGSPIDFSGELRKLNLSLAHCFVELLDSVVHSPSATIAAASALPANGNGSGDGASSLPGTATGAGAGMVGLLSSSPNAPLGSTGSSGGGSSVRTPEECLFSLSHIFFNLTHLLNLMRAHQARQTLILVLQRQIHARREKASHLESCVADARSFLERHGVAFDPVDGSVVEADPQPVPPSTAATAVDSGTGTASSAHAAAATIAGSDEALRRAAAQKLMALLDSIEDTG